MSEKAQKELKQCEGKHMLTLCSHEKNSNIQLCKELLKFKPSKRESHSYLFLNFTIVGPIFYNLHNE